MRSGLDPGRNPGKRDEGTEEVVYVFLVNPPDLYHPSLFSDPNPVPNRILL